MLSMLAFSPTIFFCCIHHPDCKSFSVVCPQNTIFFFRFYEIEVYAFILVPGDITSIKLGDIIPVDARLREGDSLNIDKVSGHVKL